MSAALLEADDSFDVVEIVPCAAPLVLPPAYALPELAFRQDAYTPEDIATARVMFYADETIEAIGEALGRSRGAVGAKFSQLGWRRQSHRPWSELDDKFLLDHYGVWPTSDIGAALARSCSAIYARAQKLGLSDGNAPPWTSWEDAQLRAGGERGLPWAQVAILIGRTASAVTTRANNIHARNAAAPTGWSHAEQARALELAEAGHRYERIAKLLSDEGFPLRSGSRSIGPALRKLGYGRGWGRPWIEEEKDLLRDAYATGKSLTPLRTRLGRTPCSIQWQAVAMGLSGTHPKPGGFRNGPEWTDAETATLRQWYGKEPGKCTAARLPGRELHAVYFKANSLGLSHPFIRQFSRDEKRAIRIAHKCGLSLTDLSDVMERDIAAVSRHAHRMGIRFDARDRKAPRGPRAERRKLTLADILAMEDPAP